MEMVKNIFIAWVSLVTTWGSLAQLYAMPEDLKGYEIMKSTGSDFASLYITIFLCIDGHIHMRQHSFL